MWAFAANTGTLANLEALEAVEWGIMLAPYRPNMHPDFSFPHKAIDNGAWPLYTKSQRDGRCYPFDEVAFKKLLYKHGADADFVVVPDIVAGGEKSLEFSISWLYTLRGIKRPLLALQDGMTPELIEPVLREWQSSNLGLFLGGTTEWKLATMAMWGEVAKRNRCWYHVGRVNTAKRIDMCGAAGANSFDGSSATRYSKTLELLDRTRRKYMCIDELEDWRKAQMSKVSESQGGGSNRYTSLEAQTAGAAAKGSGSRIAPAPIEEGGFKVEVDQGFISKLRRKLNDELEWIDEAEGANRASVLSSFDRAVVAAVLPNGEVPQAGSALTKHQLRGKKAAATRKRNQLKKAKEGSVGTGDGDPGTLGP